MNLSVFSSHGFELSRDEQEKFEKFLGLFIEYNNHTNLSAIRDEEGIVEKHFVDSLYGVSVIGETIFRHREERSDPEIQKGIPQSDWIASTARSNRAIKLLDIGSGGGFPGIPLKIVIPELQITLLDSVGKKVKAMNHFIKELELENIYALQERAEILAKDEKHAGKYDFVVSRATAYMTDILTWSLPFLAPQGLIILYKMPSEDERRDLRKITKKLGLLLEGELPYFLAEKERILYIFRKK